MRSFEPLLEAGIEFPLERLHSLVKLGNNSQAESERQWNDFQANLGRNASLVPYQLSPTLPHSLCNDDSWKAAQICSSCPECKGDISSSLTEFTRMRLATNLVKCPNCQTESPAAPFPTDLVAACLRQRSFAAKMASDRFFRLDAPSSLEQAISRYRRFMFLGVDKAEDSGVVPTLDIDLIWHTHQLYPVGYRRWCLVNLNEYINHDDTVGESDLAVGLNRTVDVWYEKFGEKYEIGGFPKQTNGKQPDRPVANYCEYNDLCWLGGSLWDFAALSSSKADNGLEATIELLSCRYRCGKCSKANCHKPSRKEDILSCRYRCGKCSKADCHKPSRKEDPLSCRYRCGKCSKADCHKPSRKEAELLTCPS
jgi:Glycine-rich domain-containing protein-like